MTLPKYVLIVDIETTGLRGEPDDHVVEVGVVKLDIDPRTPWNFGSIEKVYEAIVAPYYEEGDDFENSWVFQNTTLTPDQVRKGVPMSEVQDCLKFLLDHAPATSYNYEFDFDRFLSRAPWNILNRKLPCIMQAAGRAYCDVLPCSQYSGCPSAQSTYSYVCPKNPAELPRGIEEHRALSDAYMEAHILREMIRRGHYRAEVPE